jgi:hypothetical protein
MKLVVNSERTFSDLVTELSSQYREHKYLRVTYTTKKERTLLQNALWPLMYERVAGHKSTAAEIAEVKSYCKLMIGVPILRRDCEQFELGWKRYFENKSYEEQLFLMGSNGLFGVDGFPVTRLFDTKQGAEYTEEIARHYAPYGYYFNDLLGGKK